MLGFKTFEQADIHFDDYSTIEKPGKPRLYDTPEGKFVSMTSLLSVFDTPGEDPFKDWKDRIGVEEAEKITNQAIDRGESLHYLSELYLQNQLTKDQLKGKGKILFNRTKRFLDKIELVVGIEVALYNKDDRYAGRTDAIVIYDDQLTIMDHKNTRKEINLSTDWNRRKLFKYQLQTTGYGRALFKMTGLKPTQGCLVVGNHEKSTSNLFAFPLEEFEDELDIVIHAYHNDREGIERSLYFKL